MNCKKIKIILPIISAVVVLGVVVAILCVFLPRNTNAALPKFTISSVEFVHEGNVVDSFDAEVFESDVAFELKINGMEDLSAFEKPEVSWNFEGNSLAATISENGVVDFGNTLGEVTLLVTVESDNTFSSRLPIFINPRDGTTLQGLYAITKDDFSQTYTEGQYFDVSSISVWGNFGVYDAKISQFEVERTPLTAAATEIFVFYGQKTAKVPVLVNRKSLQSIQVLSSASKTTYFEGEAFDKSGLKIRANYEFLFEDLQEGFVVDEETPLVFGQESVVISYTFNNVTKTALQNIEVARRKLTALEVNDTAVQKEYVQGENFNMNGLIVTAHYEGNLTEKVSNFVCKQGILMSGTTWVEIAYSEGGITKSAKVEGLNVEKPYQSKRRLEVEAPSDVSVAWTFSYVDDDGVRHNDNTAFLEHNLLFDTQNGIYEIPVGAVLNVRSINPSVLDFVLDGVRQNTKYPNNTLVLKITKGQTLALSTIELEGERFLIRFVGDGKELNFSYSAGRTGALDDNHYQRVGMVFADTENHFFQFVIDGQSFSYAQLKTVEFSGNCDVTVLKLEKESDKIELTLKLYDQLEENITLDANSTLLDISGFERVGYVFVGWAKTEGGSKLNEEAFHQFLTEKKEKYLLFALWELEEVDYSSADIVGSWVCVLKDQSEEEQVTCNATYTFNTDGTFSFSSTFNSQNLVQISGNYRLSDDKIVVISFEDESFNLSVGDFTFALQENLLIANVFVMDDVLIFVEDCQFSKV